MTEYWIPAADLLSAAVIGVCFLIAVIVINLQTAGRPRTLAMLGVASVLVGTMMQVLNGSLAGAYGWDSLAYAVVAIVMAILSATGLVLLALAVTGVRQAIRARGDR